MPAAKDLAVNLFRYEIRQTGPWNLEKFKAETRGPYYNNPLNVAKFAIKGQISLYSKDNPTSIKRSSKAE